MNDLTGDHDSQFGTRILVLPAPLYILCILGEQMFAGA